MNVQDLIQFHQSSGGGTGGGSQGEQGAGGVPEREREIKKGKLSVFVTALAYIQLKKQTQQRSWLTFNVLQDLKQNFIRERSQNTKICCRGKKNSIASCEIENLSESLTS